MIKDCIEDLMFILRTTAKQPRREVSSNDKGSMGYPTVDEIMKLADVYYGPLKVSRPLHGSI